MNSEVLKTLKKINKEQGMEIAFVGASSNVYSVKKIPFSSPRMNYCTYGGIPRGRLVEFAGEENSGKTTTALDVVANAQKIFEQENPDSPKEIVWFDCENTFDAEWAEKNHVDTENLIMISPQSQSAETLFQYALELIDSDAVGLLVIDSLGVMMSQRAYDRTVEEKTYGGISMALTSFSKKAEMSCFRTGCTIIGINQMRDDMNSMYGGKTTPGGKAWKHNCSLRLMFQKGNFIDDKNNEIKRSSESPCGNIVQMNIVKTKVCKPDRRVGFYTLNYDTGIDALNDLIDVAIRFGIIEKAGAWFKVFDVNGNALENDEGVMKWHGKPELYEWLQENQDILIDITNRINERIGA